jgi:hypothetical protein
MIRIQLMELLISSLKDYGIIGVLLAVFLYMILNSRISFQYPRKDFDKEN